MQPHYALIDGDIITYRCGAATDGRYYALLNEFGEEQVRYKYKAEVPKGLVVVAQKEPEPLENALHSVKLSIQDIMLRTRARDCKVFLSPTGNSSYRYQIDPEYKANRKDQEKPHWYKEIRDYLILRYNAVVCDGIEADDALGCEQNDETIICSTDKDLKLIPGRHYNFVTKEFDMVSDVDGSYNFHIQLLTGDRVDNIPGITGLGPVKAAAILDCHPDFYTEKIVELYRQHFQDAWEDRLNKTAQLLWIQRDYGKTVQLQIGEVGEGVTYSWRTTSLNEEEQQADTGAT